MKQFTSKTQKVGEIGEDQACDYLKKQGFSVLERNIANKFGEIDIVAKKKGRYYFFEVKAGKAGSWFNPAENLTKEKLRKFCISSEYYALSHDIKDYRVLGIIVLLPQNDSGEVTFEILELS